jgi:hypothetical protein
MSCPKCRSRTFIFIEGIIVNEYRRVVNGVPDQETIDQIPSGSNGARCVCACGHNWTPRKFATFGGLVEYLDKFNEGKK